MPNWCDNTVMILGEIDEVNELKEFLIDNGNPFSFNKIKPIPKALTVAKAPLGGSEQKGEFNKAKYGAEDWYQWSIKNWGTKWDSCETSLNYNIVLRDKGQMGYSFSTAWAPPIPVYDELANMFPNINIFINYDESGMGFSGWRYYSEGEVKQSTEYDDSYRARSMYMEPDSDIWEWLE